MANDTSLLQIGNSGSKTDASYLFFRNKGATNGALEFGSPSTRVLSDVDEMSTKSIFVDEVFYLQR